MGQGEIFQQELQTRLEPGTEHTQERQNQVENV
jgi:hypothetical protein